MSFVPRQPRISPRGLTLLELLLGMTVLSIIMITIGATMATMQNTWARTRSKADTYRSTRMALENMARRISQATLATRMVQDDESTGTAGSPPYRPESDLHFVLGPAKTNKGLNMEGDVCGHGIFFQAPFGEPGDFKNNTSATSTPANSFNQLSTTLCAWGYFVEYGEDRTAMPRFIQQDNNSEHRRYRFRLMELRQPAVDLELFKVDGNQKPKYADQSPPKLYEWFLNPIKSSERPVSVVAENVVAVLFSPFDPQHNSTALGGNNSVLDTDPPFKITKNGLYDTRRALWNATPGLNTNDYTWESLHHLPPGIRMTVIATSEDSWQRLIARRGEGEAGSIARSLMGTINGRFQDGTPNSFKRDLKGVEEVFYKNGIDFRVFTIDLRMSEQ